jgi:hypothetical protein
VAVYLAPPIIEEQTMAEALGMQNIQFLILE